MRLLIQAPGPPCINEETFADIFTVSPTPWTRVGRRPSDSSIRIGRTITLAFLQVQPSSTSVFVLPQYTLMPSTRR